MVLKVDVHQPKTAFTLIYILMVSILINIFISAFNMQTTWFIY